MKQLFTKYKTKISIIVLVIILVNLLTFPSIGFAKKEETKLNFLNFSFINDIKSSFIANKSVNREQKHLPEAETISEVSYKLNVVLTAYNSEVGQCDSTPCITANGFNLCKNNKEDSLAMNGIKLGTRVRIPELYGDRVFVIRDRMNSRYNRSRGDIWMKNKVDAINFGAKYTKIEVLEI